MLQVSTSKLRGPTLVGRARGHVVVSDRSPADGGGDLGFTSGELMLLAVGSCVVGNLNHYAEGRGTELRDLSAAVRVEETPDGGYGAITVDVQIGDDVSEEMLTALGGAASSGRVTGRMRQNSEVRISINRSSGPAAAHGGG